MPDFSSSRRSPERSRGDRRRPAQGPGRWGKLRGSRIWGGRKAPSFGTDYPFSPFRAGCASVGGRAFSFPAACVLGLMAGHATAGHGFLAPWDALAGLPLALLLLCGTSGWYALLLLGLFLLFIFFVKYDLPWAVLLIPLLVLWWTGHTTEIATRHRWLF